MYAAEGSLSNTLRVEDISFVLSEDNITFRIYNVFTASKYAEAFKYLIFEDLTSCLFVYDFTSIFISGCAAVYISYMSAYHYETVQNVFFNNLNLFTTSFAIGLFIEFSECVVVLTYMKGNPNPHPQVLVWAFVLILHVDMFVLILRLYRKKEIDKIKIAVIFFSLQSVVFFTLTCTYALPAFLLLLVYPTPVIAITVYFITFIFVASITTSLCFLAYQQSLKKERPAGLARYSILSHMCAVFVMLLIVVAFFIVTFVLVYALVLGQASAITAGPYAVLSLIPSAAITIGSWTLKSKVLGTKDEDTDSENPEEEPPRSQDSQSREGSEDPESHNVIPLVSVNDGPWNYNHAMNSEQFDQM